RSRPGGGVAAREVERLARPSRIPGYGDALVAALEPGRGDEGVAARRRALDLGRGGGRQVGDLIVDPDERAGRAGRREAERLGAGGVGRPDWVDPPGQLGVHQVGQAEPPLARVRYLVDDASDVLAGGAPTEVARPGERLALDIKLHPHRRRTGHEGEVLARL